MKHIIILLCVLHCLTGQAQVAEDCTYFDPSKNPVAVRQDSSLQLVVSEYVLIKSVKARMGPGCKVFRTYTFPGAQGAISLVFEGVLTGNNQQHFTLGIPLIPDAQQRYYYASSQALVCSSPGCSNCSILNGSCVGCCSSSSGGSIALPMPLQKIQTNIDD